MQKNQNAGRVATVDAQLFSYLCQDYMTLHHLPTKKLMSSGG